MTSGEGPAASGTTIRDAENSAIARIDCAHIVDFDAGSMPDEMFDTGGTSSQWLPLVVGTYVVRTDSLSAHGGTTLAHLKHYQTHYQHRLKPQLRAVRATTVLELAPLHLRGLFHQDDQIIPWEEEWCVELTATLNKLGVATLVARFTAPGSDFVHYGAQLRDIDHLRVTADDPSYGYGSYTLHEIYALVIARLLVTTYGVEDFPVLGRAETDQHYGSVLALRNEVAKKVGARNPAGDRASNCFTSFLLTTTLEGQALGAWVNEGCLEVRGLLTGDAHWAHKQANRVSAELAEMNVGTRNTAPWYVSADGVVYLLAADFETDFQEARTLVVFELEILLALKHYLLRVNAQLNEWRVDAAPLTAAASTRNKALRQLDEIYSIEMSHKDTTRARIERCKRIMGIDALRDVTFTRLEALSDYLSLGFQSRIARQQIWLTLVFGVLGVGGLAIAFETFAFAPPGDWGDRAIVMIPPLALMLLTYMMLLRLTRR